MMSRRSISPIWILLIPLLFSSCGGRIPVKSKIVYVNSYHRGHPSSDELMDVILESFPSDSFEMFHYFMDTKRNPSPAYIEDIASQIFESVRISQPDILIVSDDNAVKYLAKPYLDSFNCPVVFCGVNLTADPYDLPADRVTGILEILPLDEVLRYLKSLSPGLKNLLVLNENTTTARKEKALLDSIYPGTGFQIDHKLVDNFDTWKSAFREAQKTYDVIYVLTHGAISGWNHEEALQFVEQHIRIPVITCEDFMMPYAVFGITKIAGEQGEWAAAAAKKILAGKNPAEIAQSRNKKSKSWLNQRLADKIGFDAGSLEIDEILE